MTAQLDVDLAHDMTPQLEEDPVHGMTAQSEVGPVCCDSPAPFNRLLNQVTASEPCTALLALCSVSAKSSLRGDAGCGS